MAAAGAPTPAPASDQGPASLPPEAGFHASPAKPSRRRGRILDSLLLLLFAVGVVPLVATSFHLVSKSREILELDQKSIQLDKARSLSQQVATYLKSLQQQTVAIARTLEVDTPVDQFAAKVARIREVDGLKRYVEGTNNFVSVSVVDAKGSGARSGTCCGAADASAPWFASAPPIGRSSMASLTAGFLSSQARD